VNVVGSNLITRFLLPTDGAIEHDALMTSK